MVFNRPHGKTTCRNIHQRKRTKSTPPPLKEDRKLPGRAASGEKVRKIQRTKPHTRGKRDGGNQNGIGIDPMRNPNTQGKPDAEDVPDAGYISITTGILTWTPIHTWTPTRIMMPTGTQTTEGIRIWDGAQTIGSRAQTGLRKENLRRERSIRVKAER